MVSLVEEARLLLLSLLKVGLEAFLSDLLQSFSDKCFIFIIGTFLLLSVSELLIFLLLSNFLGIFIPEGIKLFCLE